jgi:hypothetical protein
VKAKENFINVRYQMQSGRHLLGVGISYFNPKPDIIGTL